MTKLTKAQPPLNERVAKAVTALLETMSDRERPNGPSTWRPAGPMTANEMEMRRLRDVFAGYAMSTLVRLRALEVAFMLAGSQLPNAEALAKSLDDMALSHLARPEEGDESGLAAKAYGALAQGLRKPEPSP